jgi:phosphohistidine phosphatase
MSDIATSREIILLRHAHADPSSAGQTDLERGLSLRGQAEADAAGRWLAEHVCRPQRVVCSPSQRTRETAERVLGATGFIDTRTDPRIYEATPGLLMQVIEDNADSVSLMLVGHNPGFEELTALLISGQSGDHRGMPPGGIAVLTLPLDAALEPGAAARRAFWSP